MSTNRNYWFRAKRYGWGWGLPSSWHGWVVFIGFIGLLVAGAFLFPPDERLGAYLVWVVVLSVLFVAVALAKGEPPRWRWGNDERA